MFDTVINELYFKLKELSSKSEINIVGSNKESNVVHSKNSDLSMVINGNWLDAILSFSDSLSI